MSHFSRAPKARNFLAPAKNATELSISLPSPVEFNGDRPSLPGLRPVCKTTVRADRRMRLKEGNAKMRGDNSRKCRWA